jgi:S1-C subfamily serine protease
VRILAVLHGSQAEKDGIKRGQIVKAINGNAIKTRADVVPYVNKKERIRKMEVEDGAQ